MQGIYTVLRDRTSSRQDFIFFTDRLATLLVERAMEKLPYREVTIETPVGVQSKGKAIDAEACALPRICLFCLDGPRRFD